jgi:hypothetical protein
MKKLFINIEIDNLENWDLELSDNQIDNINKDVQLALAKSGFGHLSDIKVTSEIK